MNFILEHNTVNYIYPTLSELVTISDPVYFLFKLKNVATNEEVFFTAPNISTAITRYDKFEITLTSSTENLTAGTLSNLTVGDWYYYAYQMSSETNLSLTGITGDYLEVGYFNIKGNTIIADEFYSYTGQTEEYFFYDGQDN